jgi:MFS family permease
VPALAAAVLPVIALQAGVPVAFLAPPGRTGIALGMQNTANYLSATVTPPLAGWVAVTVGRPAALLMAAAAAVGARVLLAVPFPARQLTPELP